MSSPRSLMSLWAFSLVKGAPLHPTPNCLRLLQTKSRRRYKPGLKAARWVLRFNSYDLCVSLCRVCEEMSGSADTRCTDTVTYSEKRTCTHFFTSAGIRCAASQAGDTVTHVRPEEAVPHVLAWKADITNTVYNMSHSYGSAALGLAIRQMILSPILSLNCPLQQCEGCSPVLRLVVNDSLSKNSSV